MGPGTTRERKAVVVGGTGVIGRAVLEHLTALDGWTAVGLSRREPDFDAGAKFVSVDLLDRDDCTDKLSGLTNATDIVYAAYQDRPSMAALVAPNLTMLRNVVEVVEEASPALRHVCLMQGGKSYGVHLGPFRSPAKESDPRIMPPVFYYDQEDFLRTRQEGKRWTWSALRPESVSGFAVGNPMNLIMVIGVYAAICRELGVPFRFPGKQGAYSALFQVTDARLLARAVAWVATEPRCANEAFNITNGDYFRWQNVWPRLAEFFGLAYAEPLTIRLTEYMADKAPVWDAIVRRHGLAPYPYEKVASWEFGDAIFHTDWDNITSTIKARQYGFADCLDTEDMFPRLFAELEERQILPKVDRAGSGRAARHTTIGRTSC